MLGVGCWVFARSSVVSLISLTPMIRILQSSWMNALIGGLVYLGLTAGLITPAQFEGARPIHATTTERSANDDPSWKFRNPELDQWIAEIKREKEALALREQQLEDFQLRLETERKELTTITQMVSQLQAEFDKNVVRINDQEAENLKRQAKLLATMSPESAAGMLKEMPEDDAVKILFTMKTDLASTLLEAMIQMGKPEARRAASLTERLRRVLPPDPKSRSKTPS
jgi:flagellar motility protein MotE (MotC chaperone)